MAAPRAREESAREAFALEELVEKEYADERSEEVEVEERGRRAQAALVVFVVVAYLLCQAAVVYLAATARSRPPAGYSDDPGASANTTGERGLEALCPAGDESELDPPRSTASGQERADFKPHVLDVVKNRMESTGCEDMCETTVHYYVCGSNTEVVSGRYQLLEGKFIEIRYNNTSSASSDIAPLATFLDAYSGRDVAISYAARPSRREKSSVWLALATTLLKLLIPLPISAALLVYLGVPALRRRRQGRIIASKLASELANSVSPWLGRDACAVFASSFAVVAGATWTTLLCYDLWRASGGRRPAGGRDAARDRRRFLRYSAVGWGHPALIGGAAALCDTPPRAVAILAAVSVVYVFLNVLNLLFFAFTVGRVRRHNSAILALVRDGRRGAAAAGGPYLYFRITVLTGVLSFVFEIVDICSLLAVVTDAVDGVRVAVILGLSLLDNSLYFVILVCNARVLGLLRKARKPKPAI